MAAPAPPSTPPPIRRDTGESLLAQTARPILAGRITRPLGRHQPKPTELERYLEGEDRTSPELHRALSTLRGFHDIDGRQNMNAHVWVGLHVPASGEGSISAWLDSLLRVLVHKPSPTTFTCMLAVNIRGEKMSPGGLRSLAELFTSNRIKSQILPRMVIFMMCKVWDLDGATRDWVLQVKQETASYAPQWQPALPSRRTSLLATARLKSSDQGCICLEVKWARTPPKYTGGFYSYVWQVHCSLPELDYAKICLTRPLVGEGDGENAGLFVLVSSAEVLRRLTKTIDRHPLTTDGDCAWAISGSAESHTLVIESVCRCVRSDLVAFLQEARETIREMVYTSRRSPSVGKINYLLHLQDWLLCASRSCVEFRRQLSQFRTILEQRPTVIAHTSLIKQCIAAYADMEADLAYLEQACEDTSALIAPLKDAIVEQLGYSQSWRTNVITLLVAIYVPMSFVTSLFGMNLDGPPQLQYFNFTVPSAAVASNSTSASPAQDLTFYGNTESPQNMSWPLKLFFSVSFPLTIGTILLPWMAGPIFRWMAQFALRNPQWTRPLGWIALTLYVYAVYSVHELLGIGALGGSVPCVYLSMRIMRIRMHDTRSPWSPNFTRLKTWKSKLSFALWAAFLLFQGIALFVDFVLPLNLHMPDGAPAPGILAWIILAMIYMSPGIKRLLRRIRGVWGRVHRDSPRRTSAGRS